MDKTLVEILVGLAAGCEGEQKWIYVMFETLCYSGSLVLFVGLLRGEHVLQSDCSALVF